MANQRDFARSVWNFVRNKNDKLLEEITQIYIQEGAQLKEYLRVSTPRRTGGLAEYGTYSEIHENEGKSVSLVAGYTNYPHITLSENGQPDHFDKITNLDLVDKLSRNPNRADRMRVIKWEIKQTIENAKRRVEEVRNDK